MSSTRSPRKNRKRNQPAWLSTYATGQIKRNRQTAKKTPPINKKLRKTKLMHGIPREIAKKLDSRGLYKYKRSTSWLDSKLYAFESKRNSRVKDVYSRHNLPLRFNYPAVLIPTNTSVHFSDSSDDNYCSDDDTHIEVDSTKKSSCSFPGCNGYGNVDSALYVHNNLYQCPMYDIFLKSKKSAAIRYEEAMDTLLRSKKMEQLKRIQKLRKNAIKSILESQPNITISEGESDEDGSTSESDSSESSSSSADSDSEYNYQWQYPLSSVARYRHTDTSKIKRALYAGIRWIGKIKGPEKKKFSFLKQKLTDIKRQLRQAEQDENDKDLRKVKREILRIVHFSGGGSFDVFNEQHLQENHTKRTGMDALLQATDIDLYRREKKRENNASQANTADTQDAQIFILNDSEFGEFRISEISTKKNTDAIQSSGDRKSSLVCEEELTIKDIALEIHNFQEKLPPLKLAHGWQCKVARIHDKDIKFYYSPDGEERSFYDAYMSSTKEALESSNQAVLTSAYSNFDKNDDNLVKDGLMFSSHRPNCVDSLGISPYRYVDLNSNDERESQRLKKIVIDCAATGTRAAVRRRQVTNDPFAKLGLYIDDDVINQSDSTKKEDASKSNLLPHTQSKPTRKNDVDYSAEADRYRPPSPHDTRLRVGEHRHFYSSNNSVAPLLRKATVSDLQQREFAQDESSQNKAYVTHEDDGSVTVWKTAGEFMNQRVARFYLQYTKVANHNKSKNRGSSRHSIQGNESDSTKSVNISEKKIAGRIVAYLPKDDVNNDTGEDLWHAEYEDGEEGDLNRNEVNEEKLLYKSPNTPFLCDFDGESNKPPKESVNEGGKNRGLRNSLRKDIMDQIPENKENSRDALDIEALIKIDHAVGSRRGVPTYFRNDFAEYRSGGKFSGRFKKRQSESNESGEDDGSEDDSESSSSDSDSSDSDDESIASLERKSMKKDRQFQKIKMVAKHRKKRHIVREKIVSLPLSRLVFINGTTKGQDI